MATKSSFSIWHVLPILFTGGLNLAIYAFCPELVESTKIIWVFLVCLALGLGSGQLCQKIGEYNNILFAVYLPAATCLVFLIIQLLSA